MKNRFVGMLVGIFLAPNQAHFSKISIQNVGPNLYRKNEKTASTDIDFVQ
jgi:hypothetical protein